MIIRLRYHCTATVLSVTHLTALPLCHCTESLLCVTVLHHRHVSLLSLSVATCHVSVSFSMPYGGLKILTHFNFFKKFLLFNRVSVLLNKHF